MTPRTYIYERQKLWALRHGKQINESAYVATVDENLFEPLSDAVRCRFENADGKELSEWGKHRPKMHALHSSSALPVNVFHYWRSRDMVALAQALGIPSRFITSLQFEKLSPVAATVDRKVFRKDPNIDLVIEYGSGPIKEIGIESKFADAYSGHKGLRNAYFANESLWAELPACRDFAERVRQPQQVIGVDFPQLLKHLLGLKQRCGVGQFWLVYVWYAVPCAESGRHFDQLSEFREVLARDHIRFHSITYQELICRLAASVRSDHSQYIDYLAERYL